MEEGTITTTSLLWPGLGDGHWMNEEELNMFVSVSHGFKVTIGC